MMNIKKNVILSLVYFILGLSAIIVFDYALRILTQKTDDLFLPEMLWFALHIMLAAVVFLLFLKRAKGKALTTKIFAGLIASSIAFVIYLVMVWVYVIETGVDSI